MNLNDAKPKERQISATSSPGIEKARLGSTFIEVKNVWKKFEENFVLKNINLSIKEGEVLGILGKSGAGKSVLIHMLRGVNIYAPSQGKIIYQISLCTNCFWVDLPSKKDQVCPKCGSKLDFKSVDFWNESEKVKDAVKHRISLYECE